MTRIREKVVIPAYAGIHCRQLHNGSWNKSGMTVVLIFLFILVPHFSAQAMGLRESSIIEGNHITLGDIFYDLPRDETRVLGSAPRPGQDVTLDARTLMKIAVALDLPWRPSSAADHITLRRAATVIDFEQIEEAINTALYDEGVMGQYEISIPAEYQRIILPAAQPASLSITHIDIDKTANVFEVSLAAPSADNPIYQVRFKGRMEATVSVPVLVENLQHGRIIDAGDIDIISIKESQFNKNTVADARDLLGMTARRVIVAGRPVQKTDIIAPLIISRGELVTLFLNQGGMKLTTQVKALEDGAKGDVIRVVNTESNQSLQALVQGVRTVAVVEN